MPIRTVSLALTVLLVFVGCSRTDDAPLPSVRNAGADTDSLALVDSPEWIDDAVVYELYVRSFTPEGTFRAIIPRLDELQELGATVLWLMPIHPVGEERKKGGLGSPYAVRDYRAVNPRFGTMDDFRALVDEVHARDMKIIIDLVANHTAWDNAWVEEHPEWYTTDSTGVITHPVGTDWTDVADLNYDDPGLRTAMRDAMRFWVEDVGIDGYRCDVAELVPADFWEEAITDLRQVKPVMMLAEAGDPDLHDVGFDVTYGWHTYHLLKEVWSGAPADTLLGVLAEEEEVLPPGAERLRFTTNHDETAWDATPIELFGGVEGSQAAAVASATMPGLFLLYNGQEVGDTRQLPLFEKQAIDWESNPGMRVFYENLLARRAAGPAFTEGRFEPIDHEASDDILAFYRIAAGDTALVAVNVRDRGVTTTLPLVGETTLPPYAWQMEFAGEWPGLQAERQQGANPM